MLRERILIVEDDTSLVEVLKCAFEREGFEVFVATEGDKVYQMARTLLPDIVLLDIVMPKMDGFHICKQLKDNFYTAHIPIVVLTVREKLSERIMGLELGADDYIVKPFEILELIARIKTVLRRIHLERDKNPLTGLGGNVAIENRLKLCIKVNEPFAVLYLDINNFKAFNDYYGYARGDLLLKRMAEIIVKAVGESAYTEDFVGHIGGDDFIIITSPDRVKEIVDKIFERLDEVSFLMFEEEDKKRGYFQIKDRQGNLCSFSAKVEVSIVGCTNIYRKFHSPIEISDVLAQLKNYAKKQKGNFFIMDRRVSSK